jgi:hypothetical protein
MGDIVADNYRKLAQSQNTMTKVNFLANTHFVEVCKSHISLESRVLVKSKVLIENFFP